MPNVKSVALSLTVLELLAVTVTGPAALPAHRHRHRTKIASPDRHSLCSLGGDNKKLSGCCDSRSYCVWRSVYWQTIKPFSVTSLRTAGTHDPIQWVEFMNAPNCDPNSIYSSVTIERDRPKFGSSRSQWITERNTISARLIVCLKKTHVRVFFDSFLVPFVAKRYTQYYSKIFWRDK